MLISPSWFTNQDHFWLLFSCLLSREKSKASLSLFSIFYFPSSVEKSCNMNNIVIASGNSLRKYDLDCHFCYTVSFIHEGYIKADERVERNFKFSFIHWEGNTKAGESVERSFKFHSFTERGPPRMVKLYRETFQTGAWMEPAWLGYSRSGRKSRHRNGKLSLIDLNWSLNWSLSWSQLTSIDLSIDLNWSLIDLITLIRCTS